VTRVAQDVIPERALGGGPEPGGGLVRAIVGIVAALGVPGVGARVMGVSAPVVGGQVQGGRGLVADVMLWGVGSRDVHQEAGRVARGREVLGSPVATGSPAMLGSLPVTGSPAVLRRLVVLGGLGVTGNPVVTGSPVVLRRPVMRGSPAATDGPVTLGSPVVTGAGRGSGALGAAQATVGRQTGPLESGRPGRPKRGTARGPGRTVEQRAGAGRGLGRSGAGMAAGKAVAALESVHLTPGVPAMAERVTRALGHRAAAVPGRQAVAGLSRRAVAAPGRRAVAGLRRWAADRAQTGRGRSPVPGATTGTRGGHPAGSG
jgi:hypothetical protein